MANTEWIPEDDIAALLSVPREKIRAERPHLLMGEVEKKGATIYWQRTALERVAAKLRVPIVPPETKAAVTPETLTVVRGAANINIVIARRGNGQEVCVRVVDNRKYVPVGLDGKPMTFHAKPCKHGTWWNLVGNEPRFRGKF